MKGILVRIVVGAFALVIVSGFMSAYAQETPASPPPPGQATFTPEELDRLVAPIALYPDPLLGQILMASTYPLEVVQAARWVRDPANAALKGDALRAALADRDWDPSVKSLVPFPQVLEMMDTYLDWMQKLGDAFLAQEADVMNAVQRLRSRALAAGNLKSTPQQEIVTEGQTIVIEPATPRVVYVPVYDPTIVYGVWPYPLYPPYYFPPPPRYYVVPSVVAGFYFSAVGVTVVHWLWGWDRCDWRRHRIYIDVVRFNVINARRPPIRHNVWVHNRYHRRGVPYRSPRVRARFERGYAGALERRREFRGYEHRERPARPVTPPKVSPVPRAQAPRQPPPGTVVPRTRVPAPRKAPPRTAVPRAQLPRRERPRAQVPRRERPRAVQPRAGPPAFRGYSTGAKVRREAARGRASRQKTPPARVPPPATIAPSRSGRAPHSRRQPHAPRSRRPSRGEVRR